MVRLVFRPYTQVGRPICTSGPLRASTRVSSGFALPRHSSPSFGSHRARSRSTSPTARARRAGGAPGAPRGRDPTSAGARRPSLSLRRGVSLRHPPTRARVRLLGPCFKTGRVGCRHRRRPLTPRRGPVPALGGATRLGRTGDSPPRSKNSRAGGEGAPSLPALRPATPPRPPPPPPPPARAPPERGVWERRSRRRRRRGRGGCGRGREGAASTRSTAPGSGEMGAAGGRCKARGRGREPPSPRAFPSRPGAGRGAPPSGGNAPGGGRPAAGGRSREGILPHRAAVPDPPS